MGKWLGIAFIVVAVWVAITVVSEGTDRAFGGLFAGSATQEASAEPPMDRIRREAEAARALQEERIERQLDE